MPGARMINAKLKTTHALNNIIVKIEGTSFGFPEMSIKFPLRLHTAFWEPSRSPFSSTFLGFRKSTCVIWLDNDHHAETYAYSPQLSSKFKRNKCSPPRLQVLIKRSGQKTVGNETIASPSLINCCSRKSEKEHGGRIGDEPFLLSSLLWAWLPFGMTCPKG